MTTPNDTSDTPTKQCTKCGSVYPATTEFWYKKKTGKQGLHSMCKQCNIERARQWGKDNPERRREIGERWAKNNPEKIRGSRKKHYKNNIEKIKERKRKWELANPDYYSNYRKENSDHIREIKRRHYIDNREIYIEKAKAWAESNREKRRKIGLRYFRNNPHKAKELKQRRRARKASADGDHTAQELRQQYKRQGGKCHYCGCALNGEYHADHVIPLSRGGSNDIANIVCACASCNLSKGAKLPHEWDGTDKLL